MRAHEFADSRVMAKIERTGQIVQILRHADHVKFSDDPGWFLINTEPGRRTGTSVKWIPDSTRFAWVKKFDSLEEMRAAKFIVEYDLKVSKDADGVAIKATAGGKQLGHAEFFFDEQGRLDPQTVWVDERFHRQGIAADMYDHLKSLGYTIIRSWDQTDAGRGFWNKHRGPEATVWEANAKTATSKQVLAYINRTHHEPFRPGEKMYRAVMAHPQWQLRRVPLLNLNIPDQEYDDVDYDKYEPESDPYGRAMLVDPEHAGRVSQDIVDQRPIVIDADRYIIDGNHRAWAAKYLLNRQYINAWVPVN